MSCEPVATSAASQRRGHARGIRRLRWLRAKDWDKHVADLEAMVETPGFRALRDGVLSRAQLRPSDELLDVGAGTGLLALAAARGVSRVWALDSSPAMCEHLERKVRAAGVQNVSTLLGDAAKLPLPDASVDVVVSNYCFHHLRDAGKLRALAEVHRVLRPGGRFVFADMMFGLNIASARDREVVTLLVRRILRAGPAGVVRLAKNALRLVTGRWEHPSSVEWWRGALRQADFEQVAVEALSHEGGMGSARRPTA